MGSRIPDKLDRTAMTNYLPIEEHGLIGDMRTAALVGLDGAVDLMCYPRFDSPSIFASLLDAERGGRFLLRPVETDTRQRQMYLPDTNILLTRFHFGDAIAEISDFMPVAGEEDGSRLVRRAKAVHGDVKFRMLCAPRFDYARAGHDAVLRDGAVLFTSRGGDGTGLRLVSDRDLELRDGDAVAEFTLEQGQSAFFVLEPPEGESPTSDIGWIPSAFKQTHDYWHDWVSRTSYRGRWRDQVVRSALVLKMMIYAPSGAIVAAPSFGLPADVGGVRNWDYRYTWIRDAAFTMYAFSRLGYMAEIGAFMDWIIGLSKEEEAERGLQVMYRLDGSNAVGREELSNLSGYRDSSPVEIGSANVSQHQLDIYGALMDAVYLFDKFAHPVSYDLWSDLVPFVERVCDTWDDPDHGIWEFRGEPRHYLSSRVMSWVAVDRAVRLSRKRSLPGPLDHWREVRDRIYLDVFENFWNEDRKAFVQHRESDRMDASCLLMPLVRFISPMDPKWLATMKAVEEELVEDSLVYRYRLDKDSVDQLPGSEGTFTICSFWYVECLARSGDLQKARYHFEKILGYANHVGYFAEELGRCGDQLGNFPQAYTHLALISSAFELNRRISASRDTAG